MTGEEKDKPKAPESTDANKKTDAKDADKKNSGGAPLSEQDIAIFKRYGKGPYAEPLKKADDDVKDLNQKISVLSGIKESDTGLALPA